MAILMPYHETNARAKLDELSNKLKTLPKMALDYANLLRYLESYQNTIASIRGRVEIDRAKSDRLAEDKKERSDRNLQITILAVGTGIGAGGIMVSSYGLVQDGHDPILQVLHTPVTNRFTAAIAYSLLFGFAIGILIWGCDRLWQSYKRKRQQ